MKWSRNRKLVLFTVMVVIVLLVSLLVVVPMVLGEQFVSFSPELIYVVGPDLPTMDVVYVNGSIATVAWIGLTVNVTNSYMVPVEVNYNGFDFVWLIYNQTVADPTDVVGNNDYLVWGAFYAAYYIDGFYTFGFYSRPDWLNITGYESGYDYYVAHRDLSNYTKTIPVGTRRYSYVFESSMTSPTTAWAGRNYKSRQRVSPGTYHIYVIAYGKISEQINLTVTSVLWSQ